MYHILEMTYPLSIICLLHLFRTEYTTHHTCTCPSYINIHCTFKNTIPSEITKNTSLYEKTKLRQAFKELEISQQSKRPITEKSVEGRAQSRAEQERAKRRSFFRGVGLGGLHQRLSQLKLALLFPNILGGWVSANNWFNHRFFWCGGGGRFLWLNQPFWEGGKGVLGPVRVPFQQPSHVGALPCRTLMSLFSIEETWRKHVWIRSFLVVQILQTNLSWSIWLF